MFDTGADVGRRRLPIIVVLVASLVVTLGARLYYVQLLDPHKPQAQTGLHIGTITVPAPRGIIVDARGRPLVDNVSTEAITVDYQTLQQRPDHGASVLTKLARLLGTSAKALSLSIRPCSPKVPAPCWTGEPYQPVPVSTHAPTAAVLAVSEHREDYPGVAVSSMTFTHYPNGSLAAHVLGYTGAVTAADVHDDPTLVDADTIGRSGLEEQYDAALRGTDGSQQVQLDAQGQVVGDGRTIAPTAGDTLVTSIDLGVQQLAEQSLATQIKNSRAAGKPATSGAIVVMDPNTGRIVASASYPTYDPQQFVGGISSADYASLTSPASGEPLLDRAINGQYAPGSTFKLISASSMVMHNEISLNGTYPCPGSLTIDGRVKTNYDSETFGRPLSLEDALGYSCDTFFYAPAANEYYADSAVAAAGHTPHEYLQQMAHEYGVGTAPGVDLPATEQSAGGYADRETRLARWKANRTQYCHDARTGFPSEPDPNYRAYLTELARENCTDGWRYRAGDNADMSIGQGETTVSPLQLAVAYSAMLNGGKIFEPTFGWAVVDGHGKVVRTIKAKVRNHVPVRQDVLNYIANSLSFSRGWAVSGAFAYIGDPIQNELGGKTGTAEVYGHQDTSWLASWGPVSTTAQGNVRAGFVVVGMVEQAGTGATAAGPMLKRVWDGILARGGTSVIPDSRAESTLPTLTGPR